MLEVIETIRRVSRKIDTVMSVDLIVKCDGEGGIPVKPVLDMEGINYLINSKTNGGLGRSFYSFDSI